MLSIEKFNIDSLEDKQVYTDNPYMIFQVKNAKNSGYYIGPMTTHESSNNHSYSIHDTMKIIYECRVWGNTVIRFATQYVSSRKIGN